MGDKKRLLILTGAGAAIPWGAPKTSDITSRIINDKTFRTISGEPLGLYIIDKLKRHYEYEPDQVGFEMLLNAIEDLHSYFSSMNINSINKYKSNKPVFFDIKENFCKEVLDFESIYEKDRNNQFFTSFWLKWEDPAQFFKSFYTYCINIIANQIKEYSSKDNIESKQTLNKNFAAYLNKYVKDDFLIRYYTLNYDKIHLELSYINFFEGFTDSKIDISKILADFSINSFYNLHGSLYFTDELSSRVLLHKEPVNILTTSMLAANQEGDIILKSPILTGLKKASQILIQPSHSFFSSFLYDYINADEIHIIGYSFSDIHVNEILKYPTKAKSILIVDYIDFYKSTSFEFIPLLDMDKRRINKFLGGFPILDAFEVLKSNQHILDKVIVYVKGFEKYLEFSPESI